MTTSGPRCPNHQVILQDCSHGQGICPISGCTFEYDEDANEKIKKKKIDAFGRVYEEPDWQVKGDEK